MVGKNLSKVSVISFLLLLTITAVAAQSDSVDDTLTAIEEMADQANKNTTLPPGFSNERANLTLVAPRGETRSIGLFVEEGAENPIRLKESVDNPTVRVYALTTAVNDILESDDKANKYQQAVADDQIRVKGVGLVNSIKYTLITSFINVRNFFSGKESQENAQRLDSQGGLAGPPSTEEQSGVKRDIHCTYDVAFCQNTPNDLQNDYTHSNIYRPNEACQSYYFSDNENVSGSCRNTAVVECVKHTAECENQNCSSFECPGAASKEQWTSAPTPPPESGPAPEPEPYCGNGVVEAGEECDGSALAGETCASQGFENGTLKCSNSCEFDVSACERRVTGDVTCTYNVAFCQDSGLQNDYTRSNIYRPTEACEDYYVESDGGSMSGSCGNTGQVKCVVSGVECVQKGENKPCTNVDCSAAQLKSKKFSSTE